MGNEDGGGRTSGAWSSITLCTDSHPLHVLDDLPHQDASPIH